MLVEQRQSEILERVSTDGAVRVRVVGELDIANADALRLWLLHLLRSGNRLRLDLKDLTFIDSSSVSVLVAVAREAHSDGRTLETEAPLTPEVEQVFAFTGLDQILTLEGRSDGHDR